MITTYKDLLAKYPALGWAQDENGWCLVVMLAYNAGRSDRMDEEIEACKAKIRGMDG